MNFSASRTEILRMIDRETVRLPLADGRYAEIPVDAMVDLLDAEQLLWASAGMRRAAIATLLWHVAVPADRLGGHASQGVLEDLEQRVVVVLSLDGLVGPAVHLRPRGPDGTHRGVWIEASEIRGRSDHDHAACLDDHVRILPVDLGEGAGELGVAHPPILAAPPCIAKRRGRFSFDRVIASLLLLSSLGGAFVSAPALQSGHVLSGALILLASAYASGAALWIAASRPSVCDAQAPLGLCQDPASQRLPHPCPAGAP